ncbi:WhiB family transcriptional regulator [Streptomyces sp. NRRL S-337]|uniref:WhiB family transcriptional regulator n=1 Tax=Streptomyces sp. NRRL S-337 TaxID=1463900 RepID=UPI0005694C74|nr:WhiB family transcriptional regulator [Streptomyces sp. NRRL S-337]
MTQLPCQKKGETFHNPRRYDEAKADCASCPVRVRNACLDTAIANDERYGVWGGLDPTERWQLTHKDGSWIDHRGIVREPCGTESTLKRHRALKEKCDTCARAHASRAEDSLRERLDKEHAQGGSFYGFSLHHQLGEEPCEACRAGQGAASEAGRKTRRARPAAA